MRIGDTLKKAAGLFVELDTTATDNSDYDFDPASEATRVARPAAVVPRAAKTVEQIVREQPGPNLDEIQVAPATPQKPVVDPSGKVNFTTIYELAGLPVSAFTAEQVLELLASLPADLPMVTKRATVKVTIDTMAKTVGVNSDAILADASRKLASLAAYAQRYAHDVDEYATKAEAEIAQLELQIAAHKASIEEAKEKKASLVEACTAESDRLDDVLEFFTLDVGPSKHA